MSKIIFNKDVLLKYGEYLKETLDPWKIKKSIKSFSRLPEEQYTIHGDLKNLSNELTKEFIELKLPYNKILSFGGIEISIRIIKSNRYYSNIDWFKFLKGDYELIIEVIDNYDLNYLVSLIIHEIRHMLDFSDASNNSGLSSFDMDFNLRKYRNEKFMDFYSLVYLSLEHELVARNNQIYPYIKFKNLSKEQSLDILRESFVWKSLSLLKGFDYIHFMNKFNDDELIEITNNFIVDCLFDRENKVENKEELLEFYKIWDIYFNELSDKWKDLLLREVDIVYERKNFDIDFYYCSNYKKVMNDIWNKIKLSKTNPYGLQK